MAGLLTTDRVIEHRMNDIKQIVKFFAILTLLAGPAALTTHAQTVQAQTGSSGQSQEPAQAQPAKPADKPKDQDQAKKKEKKPAKPQPQKPIKAHVKKVDPKKKPDDAVDTSQSVEPDKILYERAMLDVKKGHYTEGRLSLQALINTYPDSEYLAKAKLAVADSYYKEGGTSNLTQSIDEYKNFIIFFPFLDEAAYAQMQIGMGHYRMMEKPDRDTTQAMEAEQEFQTFLLKYPQSPLVSKAEQHLRDTQEVLADGEYRIARFYYLKQDYAASAARLFEITERYPLYSQSDESLWMLGDIYDRAKRASRNEDEKNHWADLAGKCYDRIVQNYPMSHLASEAKARLTAMGMPAPGADPNALARMQKQQLYEKDHTQRAVVRLPMSVLKSGPSTELAAQTGTPNLNPPDDAISARDVLKQGAVGPDFEGQSKAPIDQTQAAAGDSGAPIEAAPARSTGSVSGSSMGVQIIGTGPDPNAPAATSQTPAAAANGSSAAPAVNPPAGTTEGAAASGGTTGTIPPDSTPPAVVQGGTATPDPNAASSTTGTAAQPPAGQAPAAQANGQTPAPANAQANGQPAPKADSTDSSKESSSKKKKGIKKIIPW